MKVSDRHQFILDCLKQSQYVDVTYLKTVLNVSEMTIRRDLARLEEEEFLLRVHGGARRIPSHKFEAPLDSRILENAAAKNAIGKYAAGLVENGDVITLDSSSTTYNMVKYLQDKNITIITNNISVALGFAESKTVEVILLGGRMRKSSLYIYGYDMLEMMKKYNTDKAFFSSTSLDVQHGLTNVNIDEGEAKKAMIASANELYLLMDASKFGSKAYYLVTPMDKLQNIITNQAKFDDKANNLFKACKKYNIKLHFCKEE